MQTFYKEIQDSYKRLWIAARKRIHTKQTLEGNGFEAVEFEFGEDNRGRAQATDLTLAGGEEVVVVEASAHPGKRVREGDWTCPSCQASCFASRFECYRCGAAKPQ